MKSAIIIMMFVFPFAPSFAQEIQQRKEGDPLKDLPCNIEILT
jgi:hypothetical protein